MATLNYRHFGNPGRRYPRAHYTIVNKEGNDEGFFPFSIGRNYSNARECKSSSRGARRLVAAH